jgi:hypothetical protein
MAKFLVKMGGREGKRARKGNDRTTEKRRMR